MNNEITLTIEHAMGYNGTVPNSTIIHPNLKNYLYIAGSVIVIAEMNDAHVQEFLRGHDDEITSIALSHSGKLIASGQKGKNSDLIIWDFDSRKLLFQLYEHDHRINLLSFSQDDKLLYSSGNIEDKKLIIWDTSNGYIVSTCSTHPENTVAVAWGYKVRDNRGKETNTYQFATCGQHVVALWKLDPFKGVLENENVQTGNFTREYISITFSKNEEKFLYAGTTSGDIVCFLVKNKMIVFNKIICARGITSIIPISKDQLVVGGGNGALTLCYVEEPRCDILTSIQLFGGIYSLAPSEDGIQLIASTEKGFIYRIRSADLSFILLNENHTDGIISCSKIVKSTLITHDYLNNQTYNHTNTNQGTIIGTASMDGTVRLWDLSNYCVYFRLYLNSTLIPTTLHFNEDILFTGWNDGRLRTYQINNSKGKRSYICIIYEL